MHHVQDVDTTDVDVFPSYGTFYMIKKTKFPYLKNPRNLTLGACSICVKTKSRGIK